MAYFSEMDEARRYARNRPTIHPAAIARAQVLSGLEGKVSLALDVACGTGQSTRVLGDVAERVVGLDISRPMLAQATPAARVVYAQARAEALPAARGSVPLVTCALAFHWFEREAFLREARRVLQNGGLLWVYTSGFKGVMRENPAFEAWAWEVYPARFPSPPRDSRPLSAEEAARHGFVFLGEERFEQEVSLTPEALVAYLATQTNVAAAIQAGRESVASATAWLEGHIRPYFAQASATFIFSGRAWVLRKETAV